MDLQIKLEEERDVENFIGYVEDFFRLTSSDEQKGIRELHQDFKKQTSHSQTTYHQDSFCMSISEHSNVLASAIAFKCNRENIYINASTTIIFLFIFLSKPNIILVTPDMQHPNGTVSTSNGSLGCSSLERGERINKAFG